SASIGIDDEAFHFRHCIQGIAVINRKRLVLIKDYLRQGEENEVLPTVGVLIEVGNADASLLVMILPRVIGKGVTKAKITGLFDTKQNLEYGGLSAPFPAHNEKVSTLSGILISLVILKR